MANEEAADFQTFKLRLNEIIQELRDIHDKYTNEEPQDLPRSTPYLLRLTSGLSRVTSGLLLMTSGMVIVSAGLFIPTSGWSRVTVVLVIVTPGLVISTTGLFILIRGQSRRFAWFTDRVAHVFSRALAVYKAVINRFNPRGAEDQRLTQSDQDRVHSLLSETRDLMKTVRRFVKFAKRFLELQHRDTDELVRLETRVQDLIQTMERPVNTPQRLLLVIKRVCGVVDDMDKLKRPTLTLDHHRDDTDPGPSP